MTPEELRELDWELAVGMGRIDCINWHPATDIVQAFEVVDWLIGKGWDFSVSIKTDSLWHALFEQYPALAPHIGTWHEDCPLAICLAAREVMRI